MNQVIAIGADGARRGWLAAIAREKSDGLAIELRLVPGIEELAALRDGDKARMAIDVPIGIPDVVGFRACDLAARERLKGTASAVFAPPSRELLAADNYAHARSIIDTARKTNPAAASVSAQAFALQPKIVEVDQFIRDSPGVSDWLVECHPELCFREMLRLSVGSQLDEFTGVFPPLGSKRSVSGQAVRFRLVTTEFPGIAETLESFDAPASAVDTTDVLDALAALWTALRWSKDDACQLPDDQDPPTDSHGIPMRMVF